VIVVRGRLPLAQCLFRHLGSAVFSLLALGFPAVAQDEKPEGPRWYMTGEEVELADLLNVCAEGLGLSIDYDRSQVQGRVTLRAADGFEQEELWPLANRLLLSKKLTSVQAPGEESLGIVPIGEAQNRAP